jgi:hypothetical protein
VRGKHIEDDKLIVIRLRQNPIWVQGLDAILYPACLSPHLLSQLIISRPVAYSARYPWARSTLKLFYSMIRVGELSPY